MIEAADIRTAGLGHRTPKVSHQMGGSSLLISLRVTMSGFVDAAIAEGSDYIKIVWARVPTLTSSKRDVVAAAHRRNDRVRHRYTSDARAAIERSRWVVNIFATRRRARLRRIRLPSITCSSSPAGTIESYLRFPNHGEDVPPRLLTSLFVVVVSKKFPTGFGASSNSQRMNAAARCVGGCAVLAGSINIPTAHGLSLHRELERLVRSVLQRSTRWPRDG